MQTVRSYVAVDKSHVNAEFHAYFEPVFVNQEYDCVWTTRMWAQTRTLNGRFLTHSMDQTIHKFTEVTDDPWDSEGPVVATLPSKY